MMALTGEDKAAYLLLSLEPETSRAVLGQLAAGTSTQLQELMDRLAQSPRFAEIAAQVLQEAEQLLERTQLRLVGGPEAAPPPEKSPELRIAPATAKDGQASNAQGPARLAAFQPDEAPAAPQPVAANVAAVDWKETAPERLAVAVAGESARTIALVLSQLAPERAGHVYKLLQPAVRRDVAVQMSLATPPATEVLNRIFQAVSAKVRALPEKAGEASGDQRFKKMADLLRQLERADRADALAALQERDAVAAAQVMEFLYVFEDILCLDGRSVQKLLGEIDSKTLATALKGAAENVQAKVLENMSKRAREGVHEEMGFLGTVPANQIQQAQKAMVDVIQRLDQAGELVMLR